MTSVVDEIVAREWDMFGKVQNIGGRAPCQDDKATFSIMRASQLAAWSPELLASYREDLLAAEAEGRNLVGEKYAYMMERTSPTEFARLRDSLPPRMPQKDRLIAQICHAHVGWLQELGRRYPRLVGRGRPIRRGADSALNTSFETYLWGELSTYSLATVQRYAAYVEQLLEEGRNLNEMILARTAAWYGYLSLDDAEARLAQPHA